MTPRGDTDTLLPPATAPPAQPRAWREPADPCVPATGDAEPMPPVARGVPVVVDGGEDLVAAIDQAWAAQDRARAVHRTLSPHTSAPSAAWSPLGRRR